MYKILKKTNFVYRKIGILMSLFLLFSSQYAAAQIEVTWEDLSAVAKVKEYIEEYDINYDKPIFAPEIEAISGEDIVITGHILPLDVQGDYYILSALPFASCFFCSKDGKVGAETVIELKLKYQYDWFKIDDVLTFKGRLKLNDSDPNVMYYVLENAEIAVR